MIGLVLVTHGHLAEEFISATEHVVGPQRNMVAVCVGPDDDFASRRKDVEDAIQQADEGDGVILLTDLFGSTPSNLAVSQLQRGGVEVISGINLPLLIKLAGVRQKQNLAQAIECALASAHKYINVASRLPACMNS
ncbi:MAG: PTS sugar transporter subunit IIA [Alphaproteobacteria bacterium]